MQAYPSHLPLVNSCRTILYRTRTKWMNNGSLLGPNMCEIMWNGVTCPPHPSPSSLVYQQPSKNSMEHSKKITLLPHLGADAKQYELSTPPVAFLSSADCYYIFQFDKSQYQNKDFCEHSSHFLGYIRNCCEHIPISLFPFLLKAKEIFSKY